MLIVDERGYIFQEVSDRYEGVVNFNDPSTARHYARLFDRMWESARTDPNLRSMAI